MRYTCYDSINATCRMMDIARKLGLAFSRFSLDRLGDGRCLLDFELLDPEPETARVFAARLGTLLDLIPETTDA